MDKTINVMHLLPSFAMGGAEMLLLDTVPMLKTKRINSSICTFFEPGRCSEIAKAKGIKLFNVGAKHHIISQLFGIIKFLKIVRNEKINIIHIHLMNKHGILLKIIKKSQKIVVTIHTNKQQKYYLLRRYDAIITCGEELHNSLTAKLKNTPIYLLKNAIDIRRVVSSENKSTILRNKNIPGNKTILLLVGRLVKLKRIDIALNAMEKLINSNNRDLLLLVAGDGDEFCTLNKILNEKKLENYVKFIGNVMDISLYYRIADIYINTSSFEGLPLTILEAMANKIPVIASRVPGNRELYSDNNMVLFDDGNIKQLQDCISILHNDKKKRSEIGSAGFNSLKKKYNIDEYASNLKRIYQSVVTI